MKICYCHSGKPFESCCQLYLSGSLPAPTAEALMRSRYTAYVLHDVAYIIRTTHPDTRGGYDQAAVKSWAESSNWLKLEVLGTRKGSVDDTTGFVEFKAYYTDKEMRPQVHHEYSTFKKRGTEWLFVEGNVL